MDILFLGLGSIGQRHLKLWRVINEGRVFALRSGFGPEVESGLYEPVGSIEEAARAGARVAFICNPTSCHIESALQCIAWNLDLFIEKPIDSKQDGWEELKFLVKQNQRIAYLAYPLRFHPLLQRVKDLLDGGRLGRVYSVSAFVGSYLPSWHPGTDYRQGYSARTDLGGGVLLDLSHELDYLSWIFGPIADASGNVAKVSDLEIQTEDHADVLLRFKAGVLAQVHLDYYRWPARRDLEVTGALGTLRGDLLTGELSLLSNGRIDRESHAVDSNHIYKEQLVYFLQCLQQRKQPMNHLEEAEELWLHLLAIKEKCKTECSAPSARELAPKGSREKTSDRSPASR